MNLEVVRPRERQGWKELTPVQVRNVGHAKSCVRDGAVDFDEMGTNRPIKDGATVSQLPLANMGTPGF